MNTKGPKKKKQHYVPKFYLRGFCGSGDTVFALDKESGGIFTGYRTECVSAPIIHCRCSAGMWNSLQTIPEPYSSGALSFRLRLLEADANNPST